MKSNIDFWGVKLHDQWTLFFDLKKNNKILLACNFLFLFYWIYLPVLCNQNNTWNYNFTSWVQQYIHQPYRERMLSGCISLWISRAYSGLLLSRWWLKACVIHAFAKFKSSAVDPVVPYPSYLELSKLCTLQLHLNVSWNYPTVLWKKKFNFEELSKSGLVDSPPPFRLYNSWWYFFFAVQIVHDMCA